MSERKERFGLNFGKDRPETFSHDFHVALEPHEVRLDRNQFERLLDEIRTAKNSQLSVLKPVLFLMTELAIFVRETVESTKAKSTSLKEARDFSKEIEELLAAKTQLSFSEIQEQLDITAPTLSSHLEKLAAQNKLERIVIGRNVVYRLKTVRT